MKKRYLTVYNLNYEKDWVLKNAFDIVETQEINTVYQLEFSIPKNDQDMEHCQPYWYVRYGDDGQMYRFTEQVKTNNNESTVTYHCEHVIATLVDDIMFQGPHFKGGIGHYTTEVLNFILDKQTLRNGQRPWKLGTCEPRRQFEYSWENENLLAALFSVPNCFATPYMWTYDTSSYPWTVNLLNIDEDADPDFYLMARKNILQSTETSSNLEICTRLYGLGEGEGVNQLTIKSVNNGLPYIQSSPEKIAEYGIVSRIFVDRRYQYPETLKARMETLLHELETPAMMREFDIVDLYDMSPDDMYKAEVGKICLLKDDNTKVYITKTVKNWTVPGDMKITIATKATDISTSIADLADRQRIEQVYSQGASQVYSFSFFGNATAEYPLDGYVYFPEDLKYLNEVKLKVKLDPFRSYSKTAKENGGFDKTYTIADIENKEITSQTNTEDKEITLTLTGQKSNGMTAENKNQNLTTTAGGGATGQTSVAKGGGGISLSPSVSVKVTDTENANWQTFMENNRGNTLNTGVPVNTSSNPKTGSAGSHGHSVSGSISGTQITQSMVDNEESHDHSFSNGSAASNGSHQHDFSLPSHQHGIVVTNLVHNHPVNASVSVDVNNNVSNYTGFEHSHTFSLDAHTHDINIAHYHTFSLSHSHQFKCPSHKHKITIPGHSHKITIPAHSHDIVPGIFTSGNPKTFSITVGDNVIPVSGTDVETDITEALLKNGKVPRGAWIKISIKPTDASPNDMAYISVFGNVFAFIQSYTGGNF